MKRGMQNFTVSTISKQESDSSTGTSGLSGTIAIVCIIVSNLIVGMLLLCIYLIL
jgi:hypothetical protein